MDKTRRTGKKALKGLLLAFLAIVLIVVIVAVGGTIWYKNAKQAYANCGEECPTINFILSDGMTGAEIAQSLEEKQLIKSALAFRIYLKTERKNSNLLPGDYELTQNMTMEQIVNQLELGTAIKTFQIMFLPGDTLAGVKARLEEKGYASKEIDRAFAAEYDHPLLATKPADASLEGYIYGETYEFFADATVEEILERTFDEMYSAIQENGLEEKFEKLGLTLHEGITLASVVQRESGVLPDDMPKVARVFLNRLAIGTPLGSDAIIAYRADQLDPERDKTDMSYLTSIGCPWNSRSCAGLPPTPISSPGLGALKATASPDDNNYLYFVTGDDNKMYYAETEEEHNRNVSEHCQELCKFL